MVKSTLISFNMNGSPNKHPEETEYVLRKYKPLMLLIQETHLMADQHNLLQNYSQFHKRYKFITDNNRTAHQAGVAICIHPCLSRNIIHVFTHSFIHGRAMAVLLNMRGRELLVVNLYLQAHFREERLTQALLEEVRGWCSIATQRRANIVIGGDLNIDIQSNHTRAKYLRSIFDQFTPNIIRSTYPTWFGPKGIKTHIDAFATSFPTSQTKLNGKYELISDHLPIAIQIKTNSPVNIPRFVCKKKDITKLVNEMEVLNFSTGSMEEWYNNLQLAATKSLKITNNSPVSSYHSKDVNTVNKQLRTMYRKLWQFKREKELDPQEIITRRLLWTHIKEKQKQRHELIKELVKIQKRLTTYTN
jgi:endonuclease/exonuclease/phosphatase family metal-dependent hydrolase